MDEYIPVKALWQVYIVNENDGSVIASGTTLAYSSIEAVKNLEGDKKIKSKSLTKDKVSIYAREIGYPINDKLKARLLAES